MIHHHPFLDRQSLTEPGACLNPRDFPVIGSLQLGLELCATEPGLSGGPRDQTQFLILTWETDSQQKLSPNHNRQYLKCTDG